MSEALAQEVAPLGIGVIIVEPGPFRTDFLSRSIATAANEIAAYRETAGKRRHYRETNDGRQAGDPDKAVAVILKAVDAAEPPLHLPLGKLVYDTARRKFEAFRKDMDAWEAEALATGFAEGD